jgi:DNA-binding MarR family transcriptional regulator
MAKDERLEEINLDNQCCFALYAATRAVLKALKPYLDTLGVTYPQYLVLLVLWENSPATVGDIARRLYLDTGTITPLLKRMAQNELINRERSRDDERIVYVHLTEKGRKLKEHAVNMPLNMLNKESLTEERFYRLREELFSIIDILQE